MSVAPDRFASRGDTLAFAACILLAVALRLAPAGAQASLASGIRSTVLQPLLTIQTQSEEIKASRTNYTRVVAQRDSVWLEALAGQAIQEENERLRELLSLSRRLPTSHVPAEVLHQASPTDGLMLILGAGRNQGVRPRAPVVAPGGLVGVVQSADANTSAALVWAHPEFRVSAMTENGEVFGIVAPRGSEGPNTMLLELRGVPYRDQVLPNARIITSGLGGASGVYPRGLPIGTVIAVAEEREGWSRTYLVRPAVHPASVTHVLILTSGAVDLGAVFAPEIR